MPQETVLRDPEGVFASPDGVPLASALVLSGSSGRIERDRTRVLAAHGIAAVSIRWFGGVDQPPGICEIPLESFGPALDWLAALHHQLCVVGTSKGAEAALLLAARDPRVRVVVALSPTSLVWANVGPGRDGRTYPYRSSWTRDGNAVPFLPYDESWVAPAGEGPVAYRTQYERSLVTFADRIPAARIPVERIAGSVLLSAGGDDQTWPADRFAREIAAGRAASGLATRVVIEAQAGHRVLLPGEVELPPSSRLRHGGTVGADRRIGARVLHELLDLVRRE